MSDIKGRIMSPATTSNYEVFFDLPSQARNDIIRYMREYYGIVYNSDTQLLINLSCSDTVLPGSGFATHEIVNDRHGVTEKHVYRRQFDNQIDFTFMVDKDYLIIRFFEAWMAYVTGELEEFNPANRNASYRVKFPKDYQTDALHIIKFEKDLGRNVNQTQQQYTFINAFPISINSMPVSYNQSELLRVTITMSYSRYFTQSKGAYNFGDFASRYSDPSLKFILENNLQFNSNFDINELGDSYVFNRTLPDMSRLGSYFIDTNPENASFNVLTNR